MLKIPKKRTPLKGAKNFSFVVFTKGQTGAETSPTLLARQYRLCRSFGEVRGVLHFLH